MIEAGLLLFSAEFAGNSEDAAQGFMSLLQEEQ